MAATTITKTAGITATDVITILRLVRVPFGALFFLQIFGLLPVLSWVAQPWAITGEMLAQVFVKLVALLLFWGVFAGLRWVINAIHKKKYGEPHPRLIKSNFVI